MSGLGWSFGAGLVIRLCLFVGGFGEAIKERIEVSTPLNSWHRGKQLNGNNCPFPITD